MCSVDRGARAVPICGRRRPPSPIAAADVTDNYSIAAVKAALSHPITQSVTKVTKRGYAGEVGVGLSAAGSDVYNTIYSMFAIKIPTAFKPITQVFFF